MVSLAEIKLLSTCRVQSCCLCSVGSNLAETGTHIHQLSSWGGIFRFWVSLDSIEWIYISKDKREICHYTKTKRGKCTFLSFNKLSSSVSRADRGRRDMKRKGNERLNISAHSWLHRDRNTQLFSQPSTPVCYGFACGSSHATNFLQSNCKQKINFFTFSIKKAHLCFQIIDVKMV